MPVPDLEHLEGATREWNEIAQLDPYWAVLVEPSKKHGRWNNEAARAEFFRTGEVEVEEVLTAVRRLCSDLRQGRALDFGCGVGRLTRALATHFAACDGVDISEQMVLEARRANQDRANCRFHVNTSEHLGLFADDTFDFIYSAIVLQHVPDARVIDSYLAEFVRVLRPGGMLVFQLPSYIPWRRRLQPRRRLYSLLRSMGVSAPTLYNRFGFMPMRMTWLPENRVAAVLRQAGGTVLRAEPDGSAGPAIESRRYFVTK
jgi:SAM-dependent methyltransferase